MLEILVRKLQTLKWSIRYKIGIAFALILISFIANGLDSVVLLTKISQAEEQQRNIAICLEQVQRFSQAYQSQLNLYGDAIFLVKSNYFNNTIGDTIVKTQNEIQNDQSGAKEYNREFNVAFARLYQGVFDHLKVLEPMIKHGEFDQARASWLNFTPDFDKITTLLNERKDQLIAERNRGEAESHNIILLAIVLISGFTLLSIALALFLLYLIGRVLVQPINQLRAGLARVAEGDLGQQLKIHNQDEVGGLATSFGSAITSLQQVLRGVQITESLQKVTEQLASVSKEQTEGTTAQVGALSQVILTMRELWQTAGQIAQSAAQVSNLTTNTVAQISRVGIAGTTSQEQVFQMSKAVESTLNGIEQVSLQVNDFSEQMTGLNGKTEAISKVVWQLGAIAQEVHLLALNAAIEAAGAGQYGERFRIVAHQVKQLAIRSNQAAQEASFLIGEAQQTSRSVLLKVEEGRAEVEMVVQSSTSLRDSLQELEQSAGQVGEAVEYLTLLAAQVSNQAEEIRQATQLQHDSSELVIVSTRSAEELANQTAGTTKEIEKSSQELENLSQQLNQVLKQVRLAA